LAESPDGEIGITSLSFEEDKSSENYLGFKSNEYAFRVDTGKKLTDNNLSSYFDKLKRNDYITVILDWVDHTLSFEINFEDKGIAYKIDQNAEKYYFSISMYLKDQAF